MPFYRPYLAIWLRYYHSKFICFHASGSHSWTSTPKIAEIYAGKLNIVRFVQSRYPISDSNERHLKRGDNLPTNLSFDAQSWGTTVACHAQDCPNVARHQAHLRYVHAPTGLAASALFSCLTNKNIFTDQRYEVELFGHMPASVIKRHKIRGHAFSLYFWGSNLCFADTLICNSKKSFMLSKDLA